jgi:hypothetical protein
VRIPVLLVSAAAALITLLVLRNAWRARNRSAAIEHPIFHLHFTSGPLAEAV